jgi:CheY-like chemotaxis protein
VDEAGSGAEALELTTATECDGVILDMKMPGLSGDEVFRRLEDQTPATAERVIFATGDVVSPDTLEALEATRRPVIEKPYQLEDIARAVEGL